MNLRLDLRQAEQDVYSLVSEMDRAIDEMQIAQSFQSASKGNVNKDHLGGENVSTRNVIPGIRKNVSRTRDRLLDFQRMLQEHLSDWENDIAVLAGDIARGGEASVQIRKGKESAQRDTRILRRLLETIVAALNRASRAVANVPGNNSVPGSKPFELRDITGGDLGLAAVTFETVPLLDLCRNGNMASQVVFDFPIPQLGSGAGGPASLHDKVISGLGLYEDNGELVFQIEMPDFIRALFRGDDYRSHGINGVEER